jgi:hypothetical protein
VISAFLVQDPIAQYLLIGCAALFAFTLFYLTGKINQAKDLGLNKQFHIFHGLSVVINVVQLIIFIYLLVVSL